MNNRTRSDSISLSLLIKEINGIIEHVFGDLEKEIVSVEYNSKDAVKNCLFVAVSGFVSDGHDYVRDAVDRGAVAVVISKEWMSEFDDLKDHGITLLSSRNTRRALSYISASFFRYPTSKVPVIGVTGTNGKTSVTYMLESILKKYGLSPGVIGTVNYRWEDNILNASNTTPESRDLQEIFSYMIRDGVDVIVMEVSSHALKLFRVDDIEFDAVIFTNLTRDHLDFHDTFDEYFNSKRKIFQILERSGKKNKCAVVNIDDDYGRLIFNKDKGFSYLMKSFGVANNADYKVEKDSIQNSINGVSYQLKESQGETKIELKLSGGFQVYNSLSAFAACHMMGVPVDVIYKGLSELQSIPGRFDRISSKSGFNVIVDYAHTDDALSKLLLSAKELNPERIITIFGCGGNRDRTKRPLMGITAVEGSDWVIITSDNPRDEDPNEIIKDIVHGINLTNYEIEPDREKAIEKAVSIAEDGDLVVIAGKGHEDYQLIGGRRIHFDDAEIIKKYISRREHS